MIPYREYNPIQGGAERRPVFFVGVACGRLDVLSRCGRAGGGLLGGLPYEGIIWAVLSEMSPSCIGIGSASILYAISMPISFLTQIGHKL